MSLESYSIVEIIETGQRGVLIQQNAYYSLIRIGSEGGFEMDLLVENDEFEVIDVVSFNHLIKDEE